ncbi:hypothetical protein GCM10010193_09040 [Kitasatospora atroaurantiaca]|uniref:Uncharacterized protein n=1 Tax=Kitasatospora atroaurantiaca TaxID=285545 RepID=A0A561ERX3_9ACTN|nr:hypothetical protein [Kitasatospora atroaurantiaca]TWE18356.1 hypothetical protein FB465_3423 [Kitasatospora atroaurantiaca]
MQFVKAHAARIYALAVAVLALVAHYVPTLPSALILGVVAAALGAGEAVQRIAFPGTGEHRAAE